MTVEQVRHNVAVPLRPEWPLKRRIDKFHVHIHSPADLYFNGVYEVDGSIPLEYLFHKVLLIFFAQLILCFTFGQRTFITTFRSSLLSLQLILPTQKKSATYLTPVFYHRGIKTILSFSLSFFFSFWKVYSLSSLLTTEITIYNNTWNFL